MSGRRPIESYADLLQQLLHVHRALETHLRLHAETNASIGQVVREAQFQEQHLLEDLRSLDREPDSSPPLPASRALIDEIHATAGRCPVALLGIHYVFEGSKNGGRFIAAALRRGYRLEGSDGLRYLDPHGDAQPALWREFKEVMESIDLTVEDQDAIVGAAMMTFRGIMGIHQELHSRRPPASQPTS
jgi:heme oxygenase